ncbi:hypothetical protein LINPERHAP2_LOCUS5114 [Linum perenne]
MREKSRERGKGVESGKGSGKKVFSFGVRSRIQDRLLRVLKTRDREISIFASDHRADARFRISVLASGSEHFVFLDEALLLWVSEVLQASLEKGWKLEKGLLRRSGSRVVHLGSYTLRDVAFLRIMEFCGNGRKYFVSIPMDENQIGWSSWLKSIQSVLGCERGRLGGAGIAHRSFAEVVGKPNQQVQWRQESRFDRRFGSDSSTTKLLIQDARVMERIHRLRSWVLLRFNLGDNGFVVWKEFQKWLKQWWTVEEGWGKEKLEDDTWLIECDSEDTVDFIVSRGSWMYRGAALHVKPWSPTDSWSNALHLQGIRWILVFGTPAHLISEALFRDIGDFCIDLCWDNQTFQIQILEEPIGKHQSEESTSSLVSPARPLPKVDGDGVPPPPSARVVGDDSDQLAARVSEHISASISLKQDGGLFEEEFTKSMDERVLGFYVGRGEESGQSLGPAFTYGASSLEEVNQTLALETNSSNPHSWKALSPVQILGETLLDNSQVFKPTSTSGEGEELREVSEPLETKLSEIDRLVVYSILGRRNLGWEVVKASGSRGGLMTVWEEGVVALENHWTGMFSLLTIFKNVSDDFVWALCNVYGPVYVEEEADFISELRDILLWWNLPVCMIGDFNMVRNTQEVASGYRSLNEMRAFNDFIEDFGLIDLPLGGASYTFSNLRDVASLSRIERALVSVEWEGFFKDCSLRAMARTCSDHYPLVLACTLDKIIRRPWKFELMWLDHPNFKEVLESSWSYPGFGSDNMFKLASKLKRLKTDLSNWNIDTFKRTEVVIKDTIEKIWILDNREETNQLSEEDRLERCFLKCDLDKLCKREEVSWRQKSRDKWTKDGDRNTKYFHKIANHNRPRNYISSLKIDGVLFEEYDVLASAIVHFYSSLYLEQEVSRPFPQFEGFRRISEEVAEDLVKPFSEGEIWEVLRKCAGDKAPGPDGFSMAFLKVHWEGTYR